MTIALVRDVANNSHYFGNYHFDSRKSFHGNETLRE